MKQLINISMVFGLLIMVASCSNKSNTTSETTALDSLVVITKSQFESEGMILKKPQMMPFDQIIKCNGKLVTGSSGMAKISAVIPGHVEKINCVNGQNISSGQVLFEISGNEIIEVQRDFAETSSQLKRLKSEYERTKELYNQKVGTEKDFIMAESEYKAINARYSALKMKIGLMGLNPQQIEEGNFSYTYKIKSPISGQITRIDVALGQYADLQGYLAEITNSSQLQIMLDVFEKDISLIQKGLTVNFNLLNDTIEYTGKLQTVGNTINSDTKTSTCFATPDHKQAGFVNNAFIVANIVAKTDTSLAVPNEAVLKTEFGNFMLILKKEDEKSYYFDKIKVITGRLNNGYLEIKDAPENETILWKGAYNLTVE